MFGSLGIWEILLIIAVIALLFSGKKLPQLGKGLDEEITNFKNALLGDKKNKKDEQEKTDSDNETGN
ncbi:twin-arginine translocase TatA/TatE family subunit [Acidobacteriota bacterium]